MTKKKNDLWETRGPAPSFGKPSRVPYDPSLDELFARLEREPLIEMNYDWQPSPMFFEQLQTSKAKHVTQEQIKEQLSAFRIKYTHEKPRQQSRWDAMFLNWLIVCSVIEDRSLADAPVFGDRKSDLYRSEAELDALFPPVEHKRLITMSAHWEPSDMFYEERVPLLRGDVNRTQVVEQLQLFRDYYSAEKPRDQLKWEVLFFSWLKRGLQPRSEQPRRASTKGWEQQIDESHRLSVLENELEKMKHENLELRKKFAALESIVQQLSPQLDTAEERLSRK